MSKRPRTRLPRACAYCGTVTTAWDDEDVVPKNLFARPRINLAKVPACRSCNVAKSRDDVFLRDMLVLDDAVKHDPTASAIREGPFFRSVAQGKSLVARIATEQGVMARHAGTGLYLPHLVAVPFNADRTERIFAWIARGLYYAQTGNRLRAGYRFGVRRLSLLEANGLIETLISCGIDHAWMLGKGEFRYMFGRLPNDHDVTLWVICFYNTIFFHVASLPPTDAATSAVMAQFIERSTDAPAV